MSPRSKKNMQSSGSDPFASREADNYDNPVASREFILEKLEEVGKPVQLDELFMLLELRDDEQLEALRRRLIAMSRDGQLISNRKGAYGLPTHMGLLAGKVIGMKDGYGFFAPDTDGDDLYLSAKEMARLFDGDRVMARVTGIDNRGRKEGTVVEILERRFEEVVGRYYHESGFGIVVPDSKRIPHEIVVPDSENKGAGDGQYVIARIKEYPTNRRKAIAAVTEILGDVGTPGIEIDIALRSFDIPFQWPAAVQKETRRFAEDVAAEKLETRFDLRDLPFVTIDGEDAKDFDDAVYAAPGKQGGWTLFVAIADVSHYVRIGSALDEEASNRATSVYFPGHVIPMLPEKLSNGLCSLRPETDRLVMVSEMEISASGELDSFKFYEAVIYSHARLTYNEMADMVQPAESDAGQHLQDKMRARYQPLLPHLDTLFSLYQALRQQRQQAGAMDFDSTETRMVFGEDRKIREIVPVERSDAHRLIEECMLCANVAAARLLEGARLPALYRIHEGPNQDKLDSLRDFLTEMGLYLGGGDSPTTGDYQQVLQQIAERPDRHLLQTQLIRSMMQAVYSPDNCGHFGLSFPEYTHFTSPIRRYPDLLVHRAIRYLIRNKKGKSLQAHPEQKPLAKKAIYPYEHSDLDGLAEVCSTAERRADAASYSVADWLKCEYMQDHVGDEFVGTITAVTSFGLFVELNEVYVEGLVHITELSNDYYHFDPVRHQLQGERSGSTYQLGGSVTVRIVRVDLEEKKIDLQMVGVAADSRRQSRKQKGGLRQDLKEGKLSAGKGGKSRRGSKSGKGGSSAKDGDGESRGQKRGKSSAKGGDKARSNAKSRPGSKSKPGAKSKTKPKQKRAGKSNNKAATTSRRKGKNSSSKGAGKKSGSGPASGQSAKRRPR